MLDGRPTTGSPQAHNLRRPKTSECPGVSVPSLIIGIKHRTKATYRRKDLFVSWFEGMQPSMGQHESRQTQWREHATTTPHMLAKETIRRPVGLAVKPWHHLLMTHSLQWGYTFKRFKNSKHGGITWAWAERYNSHSNCSSLPSVPHRLKTILQKCIQSNFRSPHNLSKYHYVKVKSLFWDAGQVLNCEHL